MKLLSLSLALSIFTGSLAANALSKEVCFSLQIRNQPAVGKVVLSNGGNIFMGVYQNGQGDGMTGRTSEPVVANGKITLTNFSVQDSMDGFIRYSLLEITSTTVSTQTTNQQQPVVSPIVACK